MREQLVTQAMPQKNWPMTEIRITVSAQPELIASVKIAMEPPPASVIAASSGTAKVMASSTNQPMMAE